MYQSFDSFLFLHPALGALGSVLLILGCTFAGECLLSALKLSDTRDLKIISPVIGSLIVASLLGLFTYTGCFLYVYKIMAYLLLFFGIIELSLLIRRKIWLGLFETEHNIYTYLTFSILIFLGFASFGPVTNADSLDYHIGVPVYLINNGTLPKTFEWLHAQLAGSGDMLNALGLAVSSESFGAVLQFTALACFVVFIYQLAKKSDSEKGSVLTLFLVVSPVLIFLTTAPKPQLLPQTAVAIALWLAVSKEEIDTPVFVLICILVMGAAQQKLSFYFTGGVIGVYALVKSLRTCGPGAIFPALALGLFFFGPRFYWFFTENNGAINQMHTFGLPIEFLDYIKGYRENEWVFPLNLIIPGSAGKITAVIGLIILYPFLIKKLNQKAVITATISMVAMGLFFFWGQLTARFFFVFILWGSVLMVFLPDKGIRLNLLKGMVLFQAIIMMPLAVYATYTLGPGGFSTSFRDAIMQRSADGYTVGKWIDETLPRDAVIWCGVRSIVLIPREAVASDWWPYIGKTKTDQEYLDFVEQKNITHILLQSKDPSDWITKYIGERVAGPKKFVGGTRNPLNRQEQICSIFKFKPVE